jgi:hypothetical protein
VDGGFNPLLPNICFLALVIELSGIIAPMEITYSRQGYKLKGIIRMNQAYEVHVSKHRPVENGMS